MKLDLLFLNAQVHKNRGVAQLQREALLLVQVHEGLRAYWRGRKNKMQTIRRHEMHTPSSESVGAGQVPTTLDERAPSLVISLRP